MALAIMGSERVFAVKPAAPKALPLRASGLDRSARPSKWLSCQEYGKALSRARRRPAQPTASPIPPSQRRDLGRARLHLASLSSFSYQLPQLPQDVKSLFVWFTSNKQ
jgi:hypothetical protein